MAHFNRRDFFKMVGVTGAAGLVACDESKVPLDVKTPVEKVLPYVVQPEQTVPGVPNFFTTVCDGCSAHCGVVARNYDGRVIFVAGNPDSPLGRGGACAAGVASTQDTYDPDRYKAPSEAWDTVLPKVGEAVKGGGVAWIGRYRTGALGKLVSDFVGAAGGKELHWEAFGYESLAKATELAFGSAGVLPRYVVDDAKVIVSFGADFLQTWLAPVDHSRGWAAARDPEQGGFVAEFYAIEPVLTHTGTRCDTWWAPKAGTEAGVAQALAKLVAEAKGYTGPAAAWLAKVDAAANATAAGIALEKLQALAKKLAEGPSVVFPGGAANQGENSTHLALATLVLNEVCGNIGKTVHLAQGTNLGKVSSFADVEQLLKDCAAGSVKVLFIDDLDLVFNLPADQKVAEALAKVPMVVAIGTHPNETIGANTVVLAASSALESWNAHEAVKGQLGLAQQAMVELHDTRSVGDIVLGIAKAAGLVTPAAAAAESLGLTAAPAEGADPAASAVPAVAPAVDWGGKPAVADFSAVDFRRYVAGWWNQEAYAKSGMSIPFQTFMHECQKAGGYSVVHTGLEPVMVGALPDAVAGAAVGGENPFFLYPHVHLRDGRHAHKAWLQEIPHPVSGLTWTTWAEISPKTAEKLGVDNKNTVEVATESGKVTVDLRISKGVPEGAVTLVAGNGKTAGTRYEKGWGQNAFRLVKTAKDPVSGAIAWMSTSGTVSRAAAPSERRSMKGNEDQDGRPIALAAFVGDVLANPTGPVSSVVPVHKIPTDPRLDAKGIKDFYPEPEHPTYRFGMAIDLDKCTGCGACEAACNSENNISIVGPAQHWKYRYMGWIRLDRFWEGDGENPDVRYMPAICQQCAHAPCEGVCPVVATYHNLDGLNAMIYNRCVGTRYCANNCPYSARRFNWHSYKWPESYQLMLNPEVSTREMGVMEKCTFCVQRLRAKKASYRGVGPVPDTEWVRITACAEVCPSGAITFGNLKDEAAAVSKLAAAPRAYQLLEELNTKNGVRYLGRLSFTPNAHGGHGASAGHGGGHEAPAEHGGGHEAPAADHAAPADHKTDAPAAEHGAPAGGSH